MKNLENYGVLEMDAGEIEGVNGGLNWFWQAAVATFAYHVVTDWKANVAAFREGSAAGAAAVGGSR